MNTARIVVLTVAVGAGGVVAHLASDSNKGPAPSEPVTQLQTADVMRGRADLNMVQDISDDRAPKRRDSVDVVRCGISSPTTAQT